jgi:hypothetical protein
MLLKRKVYKAIYNAHNDVKDRNYILFCPSMDIDLTKFHASPNNIFQINLGERLTVNDGIGFCNLLYITTPSTLRDFEDIKMVMTKYGWKYNRKLNKVETCY